MRFLAVGDESDGPVRTGPFLFGGFVAPTGVWTDWLIPAWTERVLPGLPASGFHMADMARTAARHPDPRVRRGAEHAIHEACNVLSSTGELAMLWTRIDGGYYREAFRDTRVVTPGTQPGHYALEPDYAGFVGFAYAALDAVATFWGAQAAPVDFAVERKQGVSHRLHQYHDRLSLALDAKGRLDLVPLIGELRIEKKGYVPLQAADFAVWHLRRLAADTATDSDRERMWRLTDWRMQSSSLLSDDAIADMASRVSEELVPNPLQSAGEALAPKGPRTEIARGNAGAAEDSG